MHYRRFHGRYGWPAPLNPAQRRIAERAALALLCLLLADLIGESLIALPPAVSVPTTAACVAQGYDLAICVDVTRSHGDWTH